MAKYYNPQGKKRGGFTKLQTGGQASIEALRRQEEPQQRALRQQQSRQSEYDTDLLRSEDRKYNAEYWNRQQLKKMEDDIFKVKMSAEEVRAKREVDRLKGKAAEYGKQAEFWEKFSTTYAKEWGKLAQGTYEYVEEIDAQKNFSIIQGILVERGLTDIPNKDKAEYTEKEAEAAEELGRLVTKDNWTDDEKKYIHETLRIFGSTSWKLQGKLVTYEEQNVQVRFAQLQELLDSQGIAITETNVRKLAKNLAYMVSKRAGITDVGLQNRLVRAYIKEGNSKYTSLFNSRYAVSSNETFKTAIETWKNDKTNNNQAAMYLAGLAVHNDSGNRVHTDPKQVLLAIIPIARQLGMSRDDVYNMLNTPAPQWENGYGSNFSYKKTYGTDKKGNVIGKPGQSWNQRYKNKGGEVLLAEIEEKLVEYDTKQSEADTAKINGEDKDFKNELHRGTQEFLNWTKGPDKDLTREEYEKKHNVKVIDLSPNSPDVAVWHARVKHGQYKQTKKLWTSVTGLAGDESLNRAHLELSVRQDLQTNPARAFDVLNNSGLFTDEERGDAIDEAPTLYQEYRAAQSVGMYDFPERIIQIKREIQKASGIKLKNETEDASISKAVNVLLQSENYYYWNDPEISKLPPNKRFKAAKDAARADLYQGEGLWYRLDAKDLPNKAVVLSSIFPHLSDSPGLYDQSGFIRNDADFQKQFQGARNLSTSKGERPDWLVKQTAWLDPHYLPEVAQLIIKGKHEEIVWNDRIVFMANQVGLPPSGLVNILLEDNNYTERIPTDLHELTGISQKRISEFLTTSKDNRLIRGPEGFKSRMLTHERRTTSHRNLEEEPDLYTSKKSWPTRYLYYKLVEYALSQNKAKTEVTNPEETTSEGIGPEKIDPNLVRDQERQTNNLDPQYGGDSEILPRDRVRDLIGDRKSITGHQI